MDRLAAWWEGDPEKLSAVYGGTAGGTTQTSPSSERSFERPAQYRGGVVGAVARWFWGQPTSPQQQRTKVHVPLASEIASASADLLFSRAITVTWGDEAARRADRDAAVQDAQDLADQQAADDHAAAMDDAGVDPDDPALANPITGEPPQPPKADPVDAPDVPPDPAQLRFDQLREASMLDATLLEAAEIAAAMSGVYLRLVWDEELQDGPWIDIVHPDSAVPEWRYGRLWAVTFWRELVSSDESQNRGKVIRHLERHERGQILHGLYEGDRDNLGRAIPLSEAPDLEGLVESLEDGNKIATVEGRLTACYVPNMRPAPQWRRLPQLAPLGRSDYTPPVLALMDQLDEVMTSWMRDIRLGKARIQVPESYLETQGRGKGALFDEDREVYTTLAMLPTPAGPPQITATQFAIRVDEHERTARALMDAIVRGAGYSSQTFGSDAEGAGATTATEINAREKRSVMTREKKIRYWDNALSDLFYTWLLLDAALAGVKAAPPAADTEPKPGQPQPGDAPAEPGKGTGTDGKKPVFGKQAEPAPGPPGTKPTPGDAKTPPAGKGKPFSQQGQDDTAQPAGKRRPFGKGKAGAPPFGQKPASAQPGDAQDGQTPTGAPPAPAGKAGGRSGPTLGALARTAQQPTDPNADPQADEQDPNAALDPNAPAAPVIPDGPPELSWPALADADQLTLAQTAQAIFAASAASKYTLVKLLHPDWDEDQIQDELARMDEDTKAAAPAPDPMSMGAEQPLGGAPFGQDPMDDGTGNQGDFGQDDGSGDGGVPFQ
jgi:hypothetical protein